MKGASRGKNHQAKLGMIVRETVSFVSESSKRNCALKNFQNKVFNKEAMLTFKRCMGVFSVK